MTDGLAADITAAMGDLIAADAETMLDACTIVRPTDVGQTPALDADGNVTAATGPTVYTGPCSLSRFRSSGVRATVRATSDNDDAVAEPLTLRLPLDADVRSGDLVTMTASTLSPTLPGQQFRVLHEDPRSYAPYRAVIVRGFSTTTP